MKQESINALLRGVADGSVSVEEAEEKLKTLPFEDIGFANIDTHRSLRTGYPEVVFCEGKKPEQVAEIMARLAAKNDNVFGTRASRADYELVGEVLPEAVYFDDARIIAVIRDPVPKVRGTIAVVTAGTADIPAAEEAAITCETLGNTVDRIYDVGVAGIHRLFANLDRIRAANVVIVAAGMEGALASVVGGLVDKPVIALPTSVGYGANFGGVSALLAMLNSCANGVGTVNIDNGFGAGYLASTINRMASGE